jgi:hypothetical protein
MEDKDKGKLKGTAMYISLLNDFTLEISVI